MLEKEFETAVNDIFETNKDALETINSYLGKNVSELPKTTEGMHERIAAEALARINPSALKPKSQQKTSDLTPDSIQARMNETPFFGSASLAGFIRGDANASIYFGNYGNFRFSGSMWTSPIAVGGGGVGGWTVIPSNGEQMRFIWFGAALTAGTASIFWIINDIVIGTLTLAVAGLAGGGGDGIGKWTKSN